MTSSDGEQRLDGLSHGPQTNSVLGENCSIIKLFQAPHCASDTSEALITLNDISTAEKLILHADKQHPDVCLERITLQAPTCVGKDSNVSSEEQKDPYKLESTRKKVLGSDRKVRESCLRNTLFQAPHCSTGCFGTPQEQKNLFEISASAKQIRLAEREAPETCMDKRLSPASHSTSEDNFDTFEELNGPNDAPAKCICCAPRKYPETYLGQQLFQEQHFIRENCSYTSSLDKKKSNEIDILGEQVPYTTRRASKTYSGDQLFRVTACCTEDFSQLSGEQKDINDNNVPDEQVYLEDIKAQRTGSVKQFFLKQHCVSESFSDSFEKPEDSNEGNALADQINPVPKRNPKTCMREKFFQTPLCAIEDNTSEEQQVSNETDSTKKHDYHAAERSQETCFGSRLCQPFHCIREDVCKNFEEREDSNEIVAAAEQISLADRSIPGAYLEKKRFHSPHCATGDFLITHEEPESSNEFNISTEQANRPSGRVLETSFSGKLFKASHCIRGLSSNTSEDENYSNESEEAAQQVSLEAMLDQICLRKRYKAPHCFTHKFYGVSKEQNDANDRNTKAERIHQATGCDRNKASGNNEKEAGECSGSWKACHFRSLPRWLQDNDFLLSGHRPQLESFWTCFLSAFRIHTETVNIWTHLAGCVLFIGIALHFLISTEQLLTTWQDRMVFGAFLASVILCLGTSSVFHAASCHSEPVCRLLGKLDYCGIAALITGSFVPWLHYGFYCERRLRLFYTTLVATLGSLSAALSTSDGFGQPGFRRARAGLFAGFGLSGLLPAAHYLASKGWARSVGWLVLMAGLYLLGAAIYASRVPERFFPGRCDIFFQSHQIFHVLVVAAALVHYHGTRELASRVILYEDCASSTVD